VESIYQQLYRLREKGTALLIVEQQVTHALDLCDHAVLLDHGTILWEGDPADAAELVATRIFDRG
jgi:branched-chain amino acid transport system ATP-binding protein